MSSSNRQPAPSLWVERPEVHAAPVARVALLAAVDGEYSYAIPPHLADRIAPGKRVLVPFGRGGKLQPAFCVGVGLDPWTSTLKLLGDVIDEDRLFSDHLLELGRWISRYYFTPLGRTLAAMVPEAIRRQSGFVVRRMVRFAAGATKGEKEKSRDGESEAKQAEVEPDAHLSRRSEAETEARVSAGRRSNSAKRASALKVMEGFPEGIEIAELVRLAGVSRGVIAAMVKAGLLVIDEQKVPAAAPNFDVAGEEPTFELGPEQKAAIARIDQVSREAAFRALLLHGVSGSGKTEVYIHSIRNVLARDRQAILLVPEIALTTQIVHRLVSRFRDVAVIHSGLTGVQRSLTWSAIARGEKKIVIGTRSAIFAPCPNLGLIVVDEEQEGSFKNQQSPRFHTRDVAIKRAQMLGIPVVLGSATPSLETWHNCERYKHFERLTLPSRVAGLELPPVEFVDLTDAPRRWASVPPAKTGEATSPARNTSPLTGRQDARPPASASLRTDSAGNTSRRIHLLTPRMEECIGLALSRQEQALLLLNRRGYASYLVCSRCKTPVVCPNCRTNMVFHQTTNQAVCHHCNAKMTVPTRCGDLTCGGTLIRFGLGTQRVEEELRIKFPDARIARADSDVLTKTSHYEEVVRSLQDRQIDILIGTQMIAKGLDFPFVTLVGVVNADTSMNAPDFRAAERTYQLVTQVAGRAGRSAVSSFKFQVSRENETAALTRNAKPETSAARVIVQSLGPPAPALQLAAQHDYAPFAAYELPIRKRLGWPPFSRIARLIVSHRNQAESLATARQLAEKIREHLFTNGLKAQVLGPQSAPLARLRNQYRHDLLIRCPDANRLLETLDHLRHADLLTPNTPRVLVDVDPVALL